MPVFPASNYPGAAFPKLMGREKLLKCDFFNDIKI
jgi:hypothetical protein